MANKNLDQVYTANPITTNADTDLMYFMQSPYSSGTDAGMTYANFKAQFSAPSPLTTKGDLYTFSTVNARLAVGGTNGQMLQVSSGAGTGLAWSTATYPATTTVNQILYSSSANVVGGITTANNGVLITSNSGVPSLLANSGTAGWVLTANSGAPPSWQAVAGGSSPWTAGSGSGSAYGGGASSTTGAGALAWGSSASAGGTDAIALGDSTVASQTSCIALGFSANSFGVYSTSLGYGATATNTQSTALGSTTNATGASSTAVGYGATAGGQYSTCIGNGTAAHQGSIVLASFSASGASLDPVANSFATSFSGGHFIFGSSFNISTVGQGLAVKEGSNAKQGTVTLSSGVGVVANTSVTANSRIFYCAQDTNTIGFLTITARTASSGFTITSSVLTDSGVVAWLITEPA